MRVLRHSIMAFALAICAFALPVYCDFVKLPARGGSGGTEYSHGCGDDKVFIGLRGKGGYWLGRLQALCRKVSTAGKWLGSTTYSATTDGGEGGFYPFMPQQLTVTCPEGYAVKGMSGSARDGLVVKINLHCWKMDRSIPNFGAPNDITRSMTAPYSPTSDRVSWSEDRCSDKIGRGFHGRYNDKGIVAVGLTCHAGTTPNVETLAAPDGLVAVNLTGPNGTQSTTVTPFVQLSWMDRSTYESGYRVRIFNTRLGILANTFERPAGSGIGTRQALNVADLPADNYTFNVCSKYSSADGGDLCFGNMPFTIGQAANCNPTITGQVELIGSGTARVRWSHTCTNPLRFQVQLRSAVSGNFIGVSDTQNGTAREENFTGFALGVANEVRVCAIFQGQGANSFCSAPRAFQFNVPGP